MPLVSLPRDEAALLVTIRGDLPALRARVVSLRDVGWPLRAIGEPLHSPRSTVRAWEVEGRRAGHVDAHPTPRAPATLRPTPSPSVPSHARALRPDVPEDDALRIAKLAPLARKVRGGTPDGDPLRTAKTELDELVLRYHRRGVSIQRLADLAGVTYRAMSVRLHAADPDHEVTEYVHATSPSPTPHPTSATAAATTGSAA